MSEIQVILVGQKVRSFDFADGDYGRDLEGERAAYVEGVVVEKTRHIPGPDGFLIDSGCDRYVIRCDKRVFGGEEVEREDELFYVPVNGTPSWGSKIINCVEAI